MAVPRPACPEGLLLEYWEKAETETWTSLDENLKKQYKEFFARTTDLATYDDVQLELFHAKRLCSLLVKQRKAAKQEQTKRPLPTTSSSDEASSESKASKLAKKETELAEMTKKHDEMVSKNQALDQQIHQLQDELQATKSAREQILSADQVQQIVLCVKQHMTSSNADNVKIKGELEAEKKSNAAIWTILETNCRDEPSRLRDFKDKLQQELSRVDPKAKKKTADANGEAKHVSVPKTTDTVFFMDGEQKRPGKILRVLPNRVFRVAPCDDDGSTKPVDVALGRMFNHDGVPFRF
jgi:hypothetical protein